MATMGFACEPCTCAEDIDALHLLVPFGRSRRTAPPGLSGRPLPSAHGPSCHGSPPDILPGASEGPSVLQLPRSCRQRSHALGSSYKLVLKLTTATLALSARTNRFSPTLMNPPNPWHVVLSPASGDQQFLLAVPCHTMCMISPFGLFSS